MKISDQQSIWIKERRTSFKTKTKIKNKTPKKISWLSIINLIEFRISIVGGLIRRWIGGLELWVWIIDAVLRRTLHCGLSRPSPATARIVLPNKKAVNTKSPSPFFFFFFALLLFLESSFLLHACSCIFSFLLRLLLLFFLLLLFLLASLVSSCFFFLFSSLLLF